MEVQLAGLLGAISSVTSWPLQTSIASGSSSSPLNDACPLDRRGVTVVGEAGLLDAADPDGHEQGESEG